MHTLLPISNGDTFSFQEIEEKSLKGISIVPLNKWFHFEIVTY